MGQSADSPQVLTRKRSSDLIFHIRSLRVMSSAGIDYGSPALRKEEKKIRDVETVISENETSSVVAGKDLTHRKLKSRHIQLIG